MKLPSLIVSSKIKVARPKASSVIKNDTGIDVGLFVMAYLSGVSEILPVYATNAAAIAGGLAIGKPYLYDDGTASALAFVTP